MLQEDEQDDVKSPLQQSDPTKQPAGVKGRPPRSILSFEPLLDLFGDLITLLGAIYFIAFGALVYRQDGFSLDDQRSRVLLEASRYGPTIFPIAFSAIVAKSLRSIATFKLEQGASVFTIEYLLASRTVFSAAIAPLVFRALSALTPLLICLWALSPLGSQAALRVISIRQAPISSTTVVSYLNFSSPYNSYGGGGGATPSSLLKSSALFTSALIGSAEQKNASQDQFGNIKIPMIEHLAAQDDANGSDWLSVGLVEVDYSSLTGIPYLGVPNVGTTTFNIETSYMYANCSLAHSSPADPTTNYTSANLTAEEAQFTPFYNGENFFISWDSLQRPYSDPNEHYWVNFYSIGGDHWCDWKYLTKASCTVSSTSVEVQMECQGSNCQSIAVRKSIRPSLPQNQIPLSGFWQGQQMYPEFWPNFINSTYAPEMLCDSHCCDPNPIETFIMDPMSPYSTTLAAPLWPIGNTDFSQRFSQLINTYWIANIAPDIVLSNSTTRAWGEVQSNLLSTYQASNTTAQVVVDNHVVIDCNRGWLVVLLLASLVMLLIGLVGAALNANRKAPEFLDAFTGLLRPCPSMGIVHASSMENAKEQVRRLRDVRVRLGDVKPEDEVGFVSIAPLGDSIAVQKLSSRRRYA